MKGSRSDNDEVSRRVLRRKKRLCYAESLMRRNSFQSRRLRRRRHRSWESNSAKVLQRTESLLRFHRASSVSSLDSVVYLGRHRKIPPLVVLSDSSSEDERPPPPYKSKLRKFRDAVVAEKRPPPADSRVDVLQNESELLNMMQEMHVGSATTNNYCTRTSIVPRYQA